MANLFELQATLSLNKDAYVRGLKEAQGDAQGMGGKIVTALGNTAKLAAGKAADAAVNAVKNFASSSLSLSKDFNASVSQIAATMGLNMQEFAKETGEVDTAYGHFAGNLKEFAQYMGANTAFTSTQAADALNYMALAGYNAQESMEMLPNVLNLAAAGGMDLAMASDMVTDAQTAFGLSAWETQRMVDQMAVTASTTNTSVSQLGEAFLTVGAYGRQLSGGTAELSMLLGALADNGIKGAEGGTHLRNVIRALATPTDEAAKRLKKLGVSVYDSNGDLRDMTAIFSDLNDSMLGKTAEQRNEILSDIFNATDLAAINALLGTSSDRWQEILSAILDADGAAQEMADTQLDNLAGDITKLSSAFDGLKLIVGDSMEQSLRPFVQTLTEGVGRITTALQEEGLAGAFREVGRLFSDLYDQAVTSLKESDNAGLQQIGKWLEDIKTGFNTAIEVSEKLITSVRNVSKAFQEGGISAAAQAAVEEIGKLWTEASKALQESDTPGLKWIGEKMESIKTSATNAVSQVTTLIEKVGSIKATVDEAPDEVKITARLVGLADLSVEIENFVRPYVEKVLTIVQNGLESVASDVEGWANQPLTKTINVVANWLGLNPEQAQQNEDLMREKTGGGALQNAFNLLLNGEPLNNGGKGTPMSGEQSGGGSHFGEGTGSKPVTTKSNPATTPGTRTRNPQGTVAGPKSKAMGMSYVPWDGYLISAHRGEALLNRDQAHDWRGNAGGIDTQSIADAVSGAIREAMANIGIMIDGQVAGTMMAGTVSRAIAGQVRRGRFN